MRALVASGLMEVLKNMWAEAWGMRMEHILRNALLPLLDQPSARLSPIFPSASTTRLTNEQVRQFWRLEYERMQLLPA
jgi:hypothetical protein